MEARVRELSPREGWMYFAVTYDPRAVTRVRVFAAVRDGGGELVEGPP